MNNIIVRPINISSKPKDLKTELLSIQNSYIGKPMTKMIMYEIDTKYRILFDQFGLNDLQYTLIKSENSIKLAPLRPIDQYAINGILIS